VIFTGSFFWMLINIHCTRCFPKHLCILRNSLLQRLMEWRTADWQKLQFDILKANIHSVV
jgi:hypothetical protein